MILRGTESLTNTEQSPRINLRCPACHRDVTFDGLGFPDIAFYAAEPNGSYRTGQRRCGNPACRAHLFVVLAGGGDVVTSYPPETIDFDASDIPPRVVAAFEEAIKSHAQQCYVAAAIMVRKALEEVCADRRAEGDNLKGRIVALGDKVVLPQAMLEGLDDLRLLGNDAAHIKARVYEEIGQQELEVAIDVAKEILKATYQYEGLMGRLRGLRKDNTD